MASRPLSPSTITARACSIVSPQSAIGPPSSGFLARALTHSAPARVLPEPRPPSISQVVQSPSDGSCSGRAQLRQSNQRRSTSASDRPATKLSVSGFGELFNAVGQFLPEDVDIGAFDRSFFASAFLAIEFDQLFEIAREVAENGRLLVADIVHFQLQS